MSGAPPLRHRAACDASPARAGPGEDWVGAAARLAGFAGAVLGWRPAEFWAATPAELAAVVAAISGDAPGAADGAVLRRLMEEHPDG